MPGCGLAVLNTLYSPLSPSADSFNNLQWGTDGTAIVSNSTALICAACAPNYAPTYFTSALAYQDTNDRNYNKDYFVTRCTPIPNCTNSTNVMMNGCQKCDAGFAFEVYSTTAAINVATTFRITRDKCVKLPEHNPNCYAYLPMSDLTNYATNILSRLGKCMQCNPGYYLNTDMNICDKLTVFGCNANSFV